jgi:hypothetical protein
MADTLGAAFATLGAWTALRFARDSRWPLLAVSAAAFAVAIQTRWIYGLVALPFVALTLWRLYSEARVGRATTSAVSFVAGAAAAVVMLLPTGLPIVTALAGGQAPPFTGDFAVYSWNPFGALSSSFDTADGRLSYSLPTGLFYLLQPFQPYWLGATGLLLLPGSLAILRKPDPGRLVILGWLAAVTAFLIGGGYQNTRFMLAALPPAAIVASIGAVTTYRYARDRSRYANRRLAAVFAVVVGIAIVFNALYAVRFSSAFVERQTADLTSIRQLSARVQPDARIISLGATPVLLHDGRDAVELYGLEAESARALVADARPDYLLVDTQAVTGQFGAMAAGRTFAALAAEPGITALQAAGIWTLYVIGE